MDNKKLVSFHCERNFYYFLIYWTIELVIKLFKLFPTEFLEIKISFDNLDSNKGKLENIKINELISLICQIFENCFLVW